MTTHMTSWSKMSLQKKWKQQTASTGGSASPRQRKIRNRGCTQSEARCTATQLLLLLLLSAALLLCNLERCSVILPVCLL